MKNVLSRLALVWLLAATPALSQTSYFNQGFLRQPSADADRNYLGITNGSGSGTVISFASGNFSPLFTTAVATPNTTPVLSFSPVSQAAHLFYASPIGGAGTPTFRAIDVSDLPGGSGGTVTSFSSGNLSPLFTTSVATPTTTPALSYTLTSQSANVVFAGPTSGGAAAPTFRSLVSGDIPSLSGIYLPLTGGTMSGTIVGPEVDMTTVKADNLVGLTGDTVNLNGPLLINDAAANGQIQSAVGATLIDPLGNFFGNGAGMSGVVLSVTNAGRGAGQVTLLTSTNPPQPAFKSLSAGGGITVTDQGGTNVIIGSSVVIPSGIDQQMTFTSPYANSTNYYLDFNLPVQTLNTPSNVIAFNYSTNWPVGSTGRVSNVFIQWTNFGRIVTFVGLATNWHVQPQVWFIPTGYGARLQCSVFGQTDTNVTLNPFLDTYPIGSNTTASFNPTNSPGQVKLWLDATRKAYQDDFLTQPVIDGSVIRGWVDLSKFVTAVTNMTATAMTDIYRAPQSAPFNVPCISYSSGPTWMQSPAFSAVAQPLWGFVMYYGRLGGVVLDGATGRFAINPGEVGTISSFFCSAGIQYNSAPVQTWTLVSCFGNGASSVMRTNGVQAVSGSAGTASPTAWFVGSDNTRANSSGSYNIAEILVLNTNLTATQLTNVESYFYRKYPFWNPPTVQ